MSIADAMASNGMKELGYEYINMDGGYSCQYLAQSELHRLLGGY